MIRKKEGEIIFIILVSALFLISSIVLARSLKWNALLFYLLSLNSYVLLNGMTQGSELLSLTLVQFAVAFIIKQKTSSGLVVGLAALTRYTNLTLVPLLLVHAKPKKILQSAILFVAPIAAWFTYNYFAYGNFFAGLADGYANNILYRSYMDQPFQIKHILAVASILLPFSLAGIFITFARYKKNISSRSWSMPTEINTKGLISVIIVLLQAIYIYATVPLKIDRYLFLLVLPITYFSYIAIQTIAQKTENPRKMIAAISILLALLSFFIAGYAISHEAGDSKAKYQSAIDSLNSEKISSCSIKSNSWVALNYFGVTALPAPPLKAMLSDLEQGHALILFNHISEPEYAQNKTLLQALPIIQETPEYIIIWNKICLPKPQTDAPFVEQVRNYILENYGYKTNTNPCFILFGTNRIEEKLCNALNNKGFTQDTNRHID